MECVVCYLGPCTDICDAWRDKGFDVVLLSCSAIFTVSLCSFVTVPGMLR